MTETKQVPSREPDSLGVTITKAIIVLTIIIVVYGVAYLT